MNKNANIIVTGAAGFIASWLAGYLNREGYNNLIFVDDFADDDKKPNWINKKNHRLVERDELFAWLESDPEEVDFVFHLGARTDTTEFDYSIHEKLNVQYSKDIWNYCSKKNIPLVYASSAATYGAGEFGYKDDHDVIEKLKPLNPYGVSKNEFDKWVIQKSRESGVRSRESGVGSQESGVGSQESGVGSQESGVGSWESPPFWAGLKFFNVYGPNEYHKGRMASVIFHAFNQIKQNGKVKLFRSHKPEFKDGEQLRDFIYVKDVAAICYWFMQQWSSSSQPASGLYNVGTGKARTFNDLVNAIFQTTDVPANIEYVDTPEDIRDKYQYFTEADMSKLTGAGYDQNFFPLEEGVEDYVKNFLLPNQYY